ncbi:MAG: DinB/UmuC family translesion DNA polymerase [Gaiellaceae bacterium]
MVIPGFDLRAALLDQPGLGRVPAALAPVPGTEPLLGPVTAAGEAAGVRPGMRMGEALATCPRLRLIEPDPARSELEWERLLRRLEEAGLAVEPLDRGCVSFETRLVERLYGGLEPVLERARAAVGPEWDPRLGAAGRRFTALAAANVAQPGQIVVVSDEETPAFLAPLSLDLLPLPAAEREELGELGVRRLGELALIPGGAVSERLGKAGREAWELAQGGSRQRVRGREPMEEIAETLSFPEAVANELTLRRAFGVLLDRLLDRPERGDRFVRTLALSARLVGGGSWRRRTTLREPSAERARIRAALAPKLAELPAPALELKLELVTLAEETGQQLELVPAAGGELQARLLQGLKQVRASTGTGSVCSVVEVAPWSRIPEARALLVPRDEV